MLKKNIFTFLYLEFPFSPFFPKTGKVPRLFFHPACVYVSLLLHLLLFLHGCQTNGEGRAPSPFALVSLWLPQKWKRKSSFSIYNCFAMATRVFSLSLILSFILPVWMYYLIPRPHRFSVCFCFITVLKLVFSSHASFIFSYTPLSKVCLPFSCCPLPFSLSVTILRWSFLHSLSRSILFASHSPLFLICCLIIWLFFSPQMW